MITDIMNVKPLGRSDGRQHPTGTILIVDDHDAVRESLSAWLKSLFPMHEIFAAASGEEAASRSAALCPDVVVMDVSLPEISGIEAARQIKANSPKTHIIMLTIHEEGTYQVGAAQVGASAFVPKRLVATHLKPAIEHALAHPGEDRSLDRG